MWCVRSRRSKYNMKKCTINLLESAAYKTVCTLTSGEKKNSFQIRANAPNVLWKILPNALSHGKCSAFSLTENAVFFTFVTERGNSKGKYLLFLLSENVVLRAFCVCAAFLCKSEWQCSPKPFCQLLNKYEAE